jgi:hypothetical protein
VVLLREVMSRESLYWLYDGAPPLALPAPPSPSSMEAPLFPDLRMPTANLVGSLHCTSNQALAYLLQRNLKVSPRPPETRYYAPTYWARCGGVQFLRPVLNKLTGFRSSDLRSTYLCLVWDQVPTGQKKGLFACCGADSCPLCDLPDSLDHVVLRYPALLNRCKEIWDDVMRPYKFGVTPAAGLLTACTERVRAPMCVPTSSWRLTPILRLRTAMPFLCGCPTLCTRFSVF